MLIGKHSSKLLGLLVLCIFLFGYLTYEKFDLYFSLTPSESHGMKLFLSICNLIFYCICLVSFDFCISRGTPWNGSKGIFISMGRALY